MEPELSAADAQEVRDRCLCFRTQRAARALARRFDTVFRRFDLTNGQFSLLMSLNRAESPTIGDTARFLAMDRTTLTAALKPLSRRGLLVAVADDADGRTRRLVLTEKGRGLLALALPVWRDEHDRVDALWGRSDTGLDPRAPCDGIGTLSELNRLQELRDTS